MPKRTKLHDVDGYTSVSITKFTANRLYAIRERFPSRPRPSMSAIIEMLVQAYEGMNSAPVSSVPQTQSEIIQPFTAGKNSVPQAQSVQDEEELPIPEEYLQDRDDYVQPSGSTRKSQPMRKPRR